MFNLIDRKIREAFSDAAMKYDALTSLHKEIGRELLKTFKDDQADIILDIGMGTGWFTKRVKFYYPESLVVGMDFASGMIEAAAKTDDGYKIVQANAAQLPFKKYSVDLIVSNLAFQWINLTEGFNQCSTVLKDHGAISLTIFGQRTFEELFTSLENTVGSQDKLKGLTRLPSKDNVKKALEQAGFKNIVVTEEFIKVRFPDMMGLLSWIKDIGANCLTKDFFIGKSWLSQANEYYDKHFKDRLGIYTTFEVLWISAKK